MSPLEIYVLISPGLVVGLGLAAYGIAVWQDRRDAAKGQLDIRK